MKVIKWMTAAVLLCCTFVLGSCSPQQAQNSLPEDQEAQPRQLPQAKITNVSTTLEEQDNWFIVPENTKTVTFKVEAEHTNTVLFWIAPTGTETGKERKIIGYDADGSDGWSLEWKVGNQALHDHISIEALGIDGRTMDSYTLNIHSE